MKNGKKILGLLSMILMAASACTKESDDQVNFGKWSLAKQETVVYTGSAMTSDVVTTGSADALGTLTFGDALQYTSQSIVYANVGGTRVPIMSANTVGNYSTVGNFFSIYGIVAGIDTTYEGAKNGLITNVAVTNEQTKNILSNSFDLFVEYNATFQVASESAPSVHKVDISYHYTK